MMETIIKLFFDICSLKKGPQDVPYSMALLQLSLGFYCVVALLMVLPDATLVTGLLEVMMEVMLMTGFVWILLRLYSKDRRFLQVLTTFAAADALISGFALVPLLALVIGKFEQLAFLIMMGLMTWHWVVCGHIIRHAISQPLLLGLGLSFLYIFSSFQIMSWLF